jgi:hypothetical protein
MRWQYLMMGIGGALDISATPQAIEALASKLEHTSYEVTVENHRMEFSKPAFAVDLLNVLGSEGWELAAIQPEKKFTALYFKRPVQE